MTQADCAALVLRGDPDRYRATRAAPVGPQGDLFTLYAFNLEVARAPWVTKEAMIAEMRLQWWRDVVAEAAHRSHEVAAPLQDLIRRKHLPLTVIDALIAARLWDITSDPFSDKAAFDAYLDATSGHLMWLAALICGAEPMAEAAVRDFGYAAGLAAYLRAVPELEARGRRPLVDGRPLAIKALAVEGLHRLDRARRSRRVVGDVGVALLAGWQTGAVLRQIVADPARVAQGRVGLSEVSKRARLLWASGSGRF